MYDFAYHRPKSLADAVGLLKSKPEARAMSGGMTLIPTLKQRLAKPSDVVDLGGIKGCGEAGAIAAPVAVINALTDAIGTEDLAMPATAQAVWLALQKTSNTKQAA